tara:strand:+ start:3048 stop:4769 length:1722 start_codon:yes stop_codon:yes gene_type:complete
MSRRSKHSAQMEGGALIAPQMVAVEQGHQELLKQSHIKVDDRYFAIDPNLDFEASTILCEDRVYVSDQTPSITQPITFTIQPQFNVFRSLSESRFVFTVQATVPASPLPGVLGALALIPKPYWAQLFVRDFTVNINNVACNDQHSRVASYAGFVKILLTQGNLKTASVSTTLDITETFSAVIVNSLAGEDTRTLQEGIINLDSLCGADFYASYNNIVMSQVGGAGRNFGNYSIIGAGVSVPEVFFTSAIELTYRPQDGIFLQPKLLPPGVNLNYIFSTTSLGTWCNGYDATLNTTASSYLSANPDAVGGYSYTITKAQYYERQYTITQTGLKAYQSLIMRQPLYFSCMTSNTLLYPVLPSQGSVQLTNVFSGRLPNIIVVALLNQSPNQAVAQGGTTTSGNINLLQTYSPLPPYINQVGPGSPATLLPSDCIASCQLTVNGRTYPHLWSSNMVGGSTQDISQWYEQYRQCALISRIEGRGDGQPNTNFDPKYKYDNPILTKAEFQSQCTFLCFNIRRNGTLVNCSGDKEVGGIDLLVNISGGAHPQAQLLIVGINTDSLATITDGGSTSSFVF